MFVVYTVFFGVGVTTYFNIFRYHKRAHAMSCCPRINIFNCFARQWTVKDDGRLHDGTPTLWCLWITRYNKLLIRLVESLRFVFVINNKLRCLLEAFLKPSLMTSCTLIVKIKMTNNLKRLGQQESYDWWRSILLLINNII